MGLWNGGKDRGIPQSLDCLGVLFQMVMEMNFWGQPQDVSRPSTDWQTSKVPSSDSSALAVHSQSHLIRINFSISLRLFNNNNIFQLNGIIYADGNTECVVH